MKRLVSSFIALPLCLHAASDLSVSGSVTSGGALSGTNPKTFAATHSSGNLMAGTLQTELNAGTGVIFDTSSGFNAAGNITISSNISKTAGASSPIVFNAANDLNLNGAISAAGGALPLTLNAARDITSTQAIATNNGAVLLNPTGEFTMGGSLNAGIGSVTLQGGTMRSATSQTITTSNFTINSGAALRLWGTVSGPLNVAGSVSPSAPNAPGSLQVNGTLTLQAGSTAVIEIGGTSMGSSYDKITATGAVTLAGTLQVDLVNNFHDTIATNNSFTILQTTGGTITGTFNGLPNGARYTLANDRGSFRVNYTATTVVLDDWQPVVTTLAWDPGTAEAGTNLFSNVNTRAGRHFFKVTTQSTDIGGWRTRLAVSSGEAAIYFSKTSLPTTSSSTHSSTQTGSDGLVLRDDQFAANDEWTIMVFATEGAQWSLVSGKPYVHDLGGLPFTDANSNGQYDIGEAVGAQDAPAAPMPPEGIRFYKSSIPTGTPAWSLWLGGSTREIALRSNKLPFHNHTNNFTRKQSGQMLLVPPVLGAGTNTWFASVVAPQGEVIGLDSRIQTVTDLAYNGTMSNVAVSGAPYRVYRVQVPVDQIAWDISAVAVAGNPDIAVRKGNVPAEFDNEAFSAASGGATEGITLVPNYLTDGIWYITVWGTAPYTFTLKNGDPVITPLSFTDNKVNDQPTRSGWRFYALTDVPSQVGALGWELALSNHVPGTQIALRRNKVPGRWQKRDGGATVTDTNSTYMDEATTNGFMQRVSHQADVWYVGIFLPQQPLGPFTLNVHPVTPPTISAEGTTTVSGIEPLKWRYYRMDIPAGMMGWDLRLTNASGGNCALVVRRDQLPLGTTSNNGAGGSWGPSSDAVWPSGYQWAGGTDWTGRTYDAPAAPRRDMNDRIVAAANRPLVPGTYYIGIYNDGADPINGTSNQPATVTLESRGIGNGWAIPINTLAFTPGGQVNVSNLTPREAAYYKVTVPANTPSWEFTLSPTAGESMLAVRREGVPDLLAAANTNIQDTSSSSSRQMKLQRLGGERYLLLSENNQTAITPGDYYFAIISEGVNPPASTVIGSGGSSATFTNVGPLAVQDLGAASAAGIVQPVSLAGSQVKAYQFNVPAGTASLEVRLDNRVGNPQMVLISGTRVPQPDGTTYDAGVGGGQTSVSAGAVARTSDDDLMTIANPPAGVYTVTVRADEVSGSWPDASANLAIVANAPVPLAFDAGTASVSNQAATAWRYFQVTVPDGIMGWDLRLTNILSGNPQMVVRRDQLPASTGTNNGGWTSWSPSSETAWPSGYQWAGGGDWTGRTYDTASTPRRAAGDRLVAAANRPLVPGTYFVGIYNQGTDPVTGNANTPAAYSIESRGIGAGQAIPIDELAFTPGATFSATDLQPREASYFKVTVPANTPRWEFTLTPSAGEVMLAARRGAIPDFNTASNGNIQDTGASSRQMELQRSGMERYSLLPENNQDFITAGDYYFAIISEGDNPPSSTVMGSGNTSSTFTNIGSTAVQDLGTITLAGVTQPVSLASAQVKSYRFTVPAGTASLEVRLDNRVGNPQMAFMSGTRVPQPDSSAYSYGSGGGQTSTLAGGLARQTDDNLINVANPPAGVYTLTVRAVDNSGTWLDASADLVVIANAPENLPLGSGTVSVTNQASTAWKYFQVTIPAGAAGWDLRLKDISGGNPSMAVRRDQLPASSGTHNGSGTSWTPSSSTTWPSGHQIGGGGDWTGRSYDTTASSRRAVDDRLVVAMGRPLEPGTYFIGVYNDGADPITGLSGQTCSYTIESRFIGNGQAIPVGTLGTAPGSTVAIANLTPREAAYFKVTVPDNTPSWEFTFAPTSGETMLAARRGFIPDFSATTGGDMQDDTGRQMKVQKAGAERYLLLPPNNQDHVVAGEYYIAAISEGVNPPSSTVIGTGSSNGTLENQGPIAVANLGTASLTPISQAVSLAGAQVKGYRFTVPEGVVSLEVQLNNRTGNPRMALMSGSRLPYPDSSVNEFGTGGGQSSTPGGGMARVLADSLITVPNPPAGTYSLTLRADDLSSVYPDATADLVIVAKPRTVMNFAASQNGNGFSHSDTKQLANGQKQFYEIAVPATLSGQPVLGWLLKVNHGQGDTTLKIYKQWGNPGSGISITGNTALVVPPFLSFNETWFIEVTATGLTQYTITSQPVTLERPAWTMPPGHNFAFGDSGDDSSGNPLPGDRGVDIGQDDWHFYAVDVPAGNSGLLRTELKAISGNPNLYIREDGVPTTDHQSTGSNGDSLVHRKMDDSGSEYGNWVPFDGRTERQLRPGRWFLGVKASGGSNARYRLIASTGQVTDLDLASASVTNQTLVGRDWRYYRFTVPADAPATWNLGFTQQVGDVVMWLRDTVPSGQNAGTGTSSIESWSADNKNQGPYDSAGHDAPAVYPFNTPPLRPGHTYYAGFRANSDATFSVTSSSTGSAPAATPVSFYSGVIDTSVPAGSSLLYKIAAPADGTRLKWTSAHPATVQIRVEQGTLPGSAGSQHSNSTGANSTLNKALDGVTWPWFAGQTYYLRIVNNGTSPANVLVNIDGKNAGTEDEDGDGLPDAWERSYFPSHTSHNGSADPDGDGVSNAVEFADGTIPNDINSAKYFLTVNANFGSVSKSPDLPKYDRGTNVTLTATPNAGLSFNGWTGGASGTTNPLQFAITANKNITANFGVPLPVALETSLPFTTGGDGVWMGQVVTSNDGVDAAQSAPIANSQQCWMETTVNGPGEIGFAWKVSSQAGDYLEFYIDGVLKTGRISGNVDWVLKSYAVDPGQHVLRWRYVKDSSGSSGSDAAWVDSLQWMPEAGFSQWLSDHFTEQELEDPAITGQDADPDRDGLANLIEYAFGTEPREGAADMALARVTPEVVAVNGKNRLRLRFTLPAVIPADIRYEIEVSDGLSDDWQVIAEQIGAPGWNGSASSSIAPAVNGRSEHLVTDSGTTAPVGKRFGRIRVALQ